MFFAIAFVSKILIQDFNSNFMFRLHFLQTFRSNIFFYNTHNNYDYYINKFVTFFFHHFLLCHIIHTNIIKKYMYKTGPVLVIWLLNIIYVIKSIFEMFQYTYFNYNCMFSVHFFTLSNLYRRNIFHIL